MCRGTIVMAGLLAVLGEAAEPTVIDLWPGTPPGETKTLPPEMDIAKESDKPVGDRRIKKITNVSKPTLAIYRPDPGQATGAAVIVCPGGGHRILAYDHEGTEVAEWLASQGIVGIVLKYRVPARSEDRRWLAAVQDAQRAVRLVRSKARTWGIDENRIGILGFSAGGETAALAAIHHSQAYYPEGDLKDTSARPDFAVLIYPGGLFDQKQNRLRDYVKPDRSTPPMFLAHAFDDPVDPRNSILLAAELKAVGVACELHVYASGGHGFGMRQTGHPINSWPSRCREWMKSQGLLGR